MFVSQRVQKRLKCMECDELLSCGPVYILNGTSKSICGRCSQEPQEKDSTEYNDRTRNEPYEAAASYLLFPCSFASRGCPEKINFTIGQSIHEINCEFRPFICPIVPRGSCDWIGSWPNLKEHCDINHKLNVLENPCNPPLPDITISNLQTYLISAFKFLFLLHVKVCVTSGKLFHSVRMFGDSNFLDKFSFNLDFECNGIKVTKSGSMLPPGIMTIQEPTALCTRINSLLDILDGRYNESKFLITIKNLNCFEVNKNVSKCIFQDKGCLFVDLIVQPERYKCKKHEKYFCQYQTKCCECQVIFVAGSFIDHLESSTSCRNAVKFNIDSVVHINHNKNNFSHILFSSNKFGTILCRYNLFASKLNLFLYTSLPSHELNSLKCSIKLTDPVTGFIQSFVPKLENNISDWSITLAMNNFPSWKNFGLKLKVNI